MVHPDDKSKEVTISDIAYAKYPDMRIVGEGDRFGIVHRLDRNTSGCLVLCKTRDAHKDMKNIFKHHKVRKVYRAIVEGNVRDDTGVIDKPMARARSDFRKKVIIDMYTKDFRGEERSAITKYKVLERSADKKFTYIELYPLTGRTHQLRVHLRAIRHPIIGDDLYGTITGKDMASRSMLHAHKLEFTLRKEDIKIECPIPADMQGCLDKYFA
jgi:23S rRNA pseudouridine1911/1915/1917 synthase